MVEISRAAKRGVLFHRKRKGVPWLKYSKIRYVDVVWPILRRVMLSIRMLSAACWVNAPHITPHRLWIVPVLRVKSGRPVWC